jgi:hypothetical protein
MMGRGNRQWRRIERALAGELSPSARASLWVQLRGDPQARARYDAAVLALRLLEGDVPIAAAELELVEDWVIADQPADAPASTGAWGRLSLLFALAAAIVLAFVLRPRPVPEDDGMAVKGMDARGRLAIEALCGAARGDAVRPLQCAPDDVLGFAYRIDPQARGRYLTLFGIDADGDAMFYAPTPADDAAIAVVAGRWQAVDLGVKLSVNHAEGPLWVYALLADRPATVEEVRGWVERLSLAPTPAMGDRRPWPRRIGAADLHGLCRSADACDVAQLRLTIGSASP